jgi:hypothetical protein
MPSSRVDLRCIRQTEAQLGRLHAALHEAAQLRHASAAARAAWQLAAERFHRYNSPVFELWGKEAREGVRSGRDGWRESALLYLDAQPRFFRSGYLRDHLSHLLKGSNLSNDECEHLRATMLKAVPHRPSVGRFCYDCRLAARLSNARFEQALVELTALKDGWTRGRAQRMLSAVRATRRESTA